MSRGAGERAGRNFLRGAVKTLGLSSLEKRSMRGDPIALYSFPGRERREAGADFFSLVSSDGTRGDGSRLCQGGLDSELGSISLVRVQSQTSRGFLERWAMPPGCVFTVGSQV